MTNIRNIEESDVTWEYDAVEDDTPVYGNAACSGNDSLDRAVENTILDRLNAGETWAWALVVVTGTYMGLSSHIALGGVSVKDSDEFEHSATYSNMKDMILEDLNVQLVDIIEALGK